MKEYGTNTTLGKFCTHLDIYTMQVASMRLSSKKMTEKLRKCSESPKQQRASIWGIELSRNRGNEIYVTAFRSVLGKDFTGEEVLRILD
jgi:hypothetical protein